ncbi:MAG: YegS/Rv2252/BmrU family lipid kinase [Fusobacteriaceae bacterium]|nr:YegS/Rv2252/BmrU family lipid kinase [Fusobacteriaceae bacterium]
MKRVKLIYNPHSGKRELLDNFDIVFKCYQEKGYMIDTFRVGRGAQIKDAFFHDYSEYNHILIAGGDGTVNNTVNAMKNANIDLPIAILPLGTANDFAGNLGMPKDIEKACKQILNSEVRNIDLGLANDKYFVNILSTGIFTDISHKVNPKMKKNFGKLAYYLRGIQDAYNLKPLGIDVVSHETENLEEKYIMFVFNGRTAGKINLAYKAEIDDGKFDVILIKAKGIIKSINILFKILNGTYLEDEDVVEHFKTDELLIHSDEDIFIDIDGEKGPKCPVEITCIKGGLRVLGYK